MKTSRDENLAVLYLCLSCLLTFSTAAHAQWSYLINNGTVTITGYSGPGGKVAIPETINALSVMSVADFACQGLSNVTDLEIADSVTSIGIQAFSHCSSLTNVTFGQRAASLANLCFEWCSSLKSAHFRGNKPVFGAGVFDSVYGLDFYYLAGTSGWGLFPPINYASIRQWTLPQPVILDFHESFGVHSNIFGFRVSWAANRSVVIEAGDGLVGGQWFPLATNTLTPANGWFTFSDADWTNYPTRLYRVRSQ